MTVDRLEVPVIGGGFAPFPVTALAEARERAVDSDALGLVRERLCNGTAGFTHRIEMEWLSMHRTRRPLVEVAE